MITNPLIWPDGEPRKTIRYYANFNVTLSQAVNHMADEVRKMGGKDLVITSDLPATKTGHAFLATAKAPDDPGVAIWFRLDGEEHCLACDEWRTVRDNLRALGKTVEAFRGIERWGGRQLMKKAFVGFAALPEALSTVALERPWWEVLGVQEGASPGVIASA
ncbi:MAG: hypothetical protein KC442_23410 [Thermomicrobiales bacterium]|nr:hypothetical protein [Thermomicrobiales bacterium]